MFIGLAIAKSPRHVSVILSIYLVLLSIIILKRVSFNKEKIRLKLAIESFLELDNLTRNKIQEASLLETSLNSGISRYKTLEKILEGANGLVRLEDICDYIVSATHYLLGKSKGVCRLYLVSRKTHELELVKIKGNAIREESLNTLDVFDNWVVLNVTPLLIENTAEDFRFLSETSAVEGGKIGSLISAPIYREHKFLGILRIDSEITGFFEQRDLIILDILTDLFALPIENTMLYQATHELSIIDGLTGLYLRRHIDDVLANEINSARKNRSELSLLMFDIDNFKKTNDKYGHMAGDIVLKNLSVWLKENFAAEGGIVGRFGGEEFIVVFPGKSKEESIVFSKSLLEKINFQRIMLRNEEIKIGVSCGIASLKDAKDKEDLIKRADQALYKAKMTGKNKICY